MREQIAEIDVKAESLSGVVKTFQIKGHQHYSRAELKAQQSKMGAVFKLEKDITLKMNTLAQLGKLA